VNLVEAKQIQEQLEKLHYWDARVLSFDVKYFGDEATLIFEDSDENIKVLFAGCYNIRVTTNPQDRRNPIKELTIPQIPYFIQAIQVGDIRTDDLDLLSCKILMPPMAIEVNCNLINIEKVK